MVRLMKILHILSGGEVGGIEVLCKEYGVHSKHENTFLFLWHDGPIISEMNAAGLKTIVLKASKKDFFGPLIAIYKVCKEQNIDVIIEHHTAIVAHLYLYILKKFFPQITLISYLHCNVADICADEKKFMFVRKWILSRTFNQSKYIIAISKSVEASCHKYFDVKKDKVIVNYNGVDLSRFDQQYSIKEKRDFVQLIYVGRLIHEKGVQNTLYALAELNADLDYKLNIVGDGPYKQELEQLAQKLGLTKVKFWGQRRDVSKLLHESDVFVHCPNWQEGFGITIIEAMASGLICLCNDSGALPEIICDGYSGIIIPQGDQKAFVEAMNSVIVNIKTGKYQKMMLNARQRSKDFSIESFAERLDSIVEN